MQASCQTPCALHVSLSPHSCTPPWPQDHYDFGMRALKSILVMAGGLKRGNPHLTEEVSLIRACRDANIPKFVAPDIPLFNGILADLFPGYVLFTGWCCACAVRGGGGGAGTSPPVAV